jgi:uncharacterized membrane protein YdjX (TVP38/TMEM64 family)
MTVSSRMQMLEDRLAWRAVLLLGFCVVAAPLVSSAVVHSSLMRILSAAEAVIRQYPTAGALAFVVFAAISAMFAFMSTALMVPVAVLTWGNTATSLMLWLGWIGGGVASYGLSRWLGRRLLDRLGGRRLLHRLERWIRPDATFGMVLILQLALPSEMPGYLLGLVRYPLRKYCFALALAELPYALATVYVGQGLIEQRGGLIVSVGALIGLVSLAAVYALRNHGRPDDVNSQDDATPPVCPCSAGLNGSDPSNCRSE